MPVVLEKCAFGCPGLSPKDFSGHTLWGDPICDWAAGMWTHDSHCCGALRIETESVG